VGGPCCDLEICAAAHCKSECYVPCDFHRDSTPQCPPCLQAACAAQLAACP
jgi:hypothetical protein